MPYKIVRRDAAGIEERVASANSTAANGCRYFFFQFP
jgi:hypothetical protein